MAKSAEDGVVDPQCKVHGVDNLYIASSSVFVTSGQANSTFMAVAFALRLVEHLAPAAKCNALALSLHDENDCRTARKKQAEIT